MRKDPTKEKTHIDDIASGLQKIKKIVCNSDKGEMNIELEAMESAVSVYRDTLKGPLPMLYECDSLKGCCHYVASAADLVRFIETVPHKKQLSQIREHLKLIEQGGFGLYSTYQNMQRNGDTLREIIRAHDIDLPRIEAAQDASRKSIELMLGLACLNKFEIVELEDPNRSSDTDPNPDLIIHDNGQKYGIACKSIMSKNSSNFKHRIEEAIGQIQKAIEADKVDKGCGVVFIDISSLINHDQLYVPRQRPYWNKDEVNEALSAAKDQILGELLKEGDIYPQLNPLFKGKNAAPCVVIYSHSLMIGGDSFGAFPHYCKAIRVLQCGDYSKVKCFLDDLNTAIHCQ